MVFGWTDATNYIAGMQTQSTSQQSPAHVPAKKKSPAHVHSLVKHAAGLCWLSPGE
jgi:hypothetical protein